MQKYTLSRVSIKDNRDGVLLKTKKGEQYWNIGIQTQETGDVWYSSAIFQKESPAMSFQTGQTVTLHLYEEEYSGKMYKKFKVPSQLDDLEARVSALEAKVQ